MAISRAGTYGVDGRIVKAMQGHNFNIRNAIEQSKMKKTDNMKRTISKLPTIYAAALCAVVLAAPSARANPINGSIVFGAADVTVNNANLADATVFDLTGVFTTTGSGAYSSPSVPMFTTVTFDNFAFNPTTPGETITPLWTFDVGKDVYSFNATSITTAVFVGNEWVIGGLGDAFATGYSETPGKWTVNLSQSGATFGFDSTAATGTAVPDGGSTVALLGSAFMGLGAFGRKMCR
jgi:hypothetical protein